MIERTVRVIVTTVNGRDIVVTKNDDGEYELRAERESDSDYWILSEAELADLCEGIREAFLPEVVEVTLPAHRHRYGEDGVCVKDGCGGVRQRRRKVAAQVREVTA